MKGKKLILHILFLVIFISPNAFSYDHVLELKVTVLILGMAGVLVNIFMRESPEQLNNETANNQSNDNQQPGKPRG